MSMKTLYKAVHRSFTPKRQQPCCLLSNKKRVDELTVLFFFLYKETLLRNFKRNKLCGLISATVGELIQIQRALYFKLHFYEVLKQAKQIYGD